MSATKQDLWLIKDQEAPFLQVNEYTQGDDDLWQLIADLDFSSAGDLVEVSKESTIDLDSTSQPNETVAGDQIGQEAAIPGLERAKASISMLVGGGVMPSGESYTEPYFGRLLRILCGWDLATNSTSNSGGPSLIYTAGRQKTAGLIAHFTGAEPGEDGDHILRLFANMQAGFTIEIKAGECPKITFDAGGAYVGEIDLTSFSTLAYPTTITKAGWKFNAVKAAPSFLFMGERVPFSTITIKSGQATAVWEDGTALGGIGGCDMVDRALTMDITFRSDAVAADISKHPARLMRAGTEAAFQLGWGASNAVVFSSAACQITKAEHKNNNGLLNFQASAQFNNNDLSILLAAALS